MKIGDLHLLRRHAGLDRPTRVDEIHVSKREPLLLDREIEKSQATGGINGLLLNI